MNELQAPPVPSPSDLRLSSRQAHLVREITVHRRHRRRGSLAVGGSALVAGGVTTAVLVLGGSGTTNAFAAWTPSPTTPAPGQVTSAEATCVAAAASPPAGAPVVSTTQVSLVDTRGPFTLVLFGSSTSTQGALMCVSGPSVSPSTEQNSQMIQSFGSQPSPPGAGQITLDRLLPEAAGDGQRYTVAEGSVGSGVTAVTLTLSDGSQVVATTGNGFFLAWWPGSAGVTSATLTTDSGTTSQPINSPTSDNGSSSNQVMHG